MLYLSIHGCKSFMIIDIGECLIGIHNCSQLCVELDGGYECNCYDGYELRDDGVSCEGIVTHSYVKFAHRAL